MLTLAAGSSAADSASEYELKAAFLYKFTKFVAWPSEAFAGPDSPIVVGIAGFDPFGPVLEEMVAEQSVGGRPIAVRRFETPERLGLCHILFIGRKEDRQDWLRAAEGELAAIALTVGEDEGFQKQGAITLLLRDNHIRLAVNLGAVHRTGLQVSSKMLALATIVGEPGLRK